MKFQAIGMLEVSPGASICMGGVYTQNNSPSLIRVTIERALPAKVKAWKWAYTDAADSAQGINQVIHVTECVYPGIAAVFNAWRRNGVRNVENRVVLGPIADTETEIDL